MNRPSISVIVPGTIGFLAMTALGWNLANPPQSRSKADVRPAADVPHDRGHPRKAPRDGGIVAEQMRAVRNAGSPSERMRMTLALANSLPPSEFAAWVEGDRFDFRKGPELYVFREIIFERWIKEDPESLIPWAGRNNHGQAGRALLFLAENEPQRLMDHYRSHPDHPTELGILREVAKRHPDLALQRIQELSAAGLPSDTTQLAKGLLDELAKNSPAALEAAFSSLAPDLRREAEIALSGQRLTVSFPTEVRALWERPDGWQIFASNLSGNRELGTKLIADLANLPDNWKSGMAQQSYYLISDKNGKEWFTAGLETAGFSATDAKRIRERALLSLASNDPEYALTHLAGSGVDLNRKADVISYALRSARGDSAQAEKLINLLGSEEDRQLARNQLELADLASGGVKVQKPAEWLEKIGSVGGASRDSQQLLYQLKRLDKQQTAELRSLFNGLPADQQQNIGQVVAAGGMYASLDSGFAGDAIRSLLTNPPAVSPADSGSTGEDPTMACSTYAVKLSMNDPAAATSWIKTLPDGEAKVWVCKNVAANWSQYDPKAMNQWLQTLPPDTREQVVRYLPTRR